MNYFKQSAEELQEFLKFIDEDIGNVRRVVNTIEEEGVEAEFVVHAKAETVDESAENTGVAAEEVIKTLIFMADKPVAVLCPGDTSVSEEKLEGVLGSEVRMARPEEVTEATGYIVGGVSPFDLDIKVLMEESILEKGEVKPAAGSRAVGVSIDAEDLKQISKAETADLSR